MKNLFVLMVVTMFFASANAVTPSKNSTGTVTETPVQDQALTEQLAKEVEGEQAAAPAPANANSMSSNNANTDANGELTLDSEQANEQAVAAEIENAETQQIITRMQENKKKNEKNIYISAVVGTGAYPDVNNIQGSYSATMALGYKLNRFMIEGGLGLTRYQMDVLNMSIQNRRDNYDIDQYTAFLGAKYRVLKCRVVPTVGGILAYTHRAFTLTNPYNQPVTVETIDAGTSQTTDFGVTAGIDYEFSKEFAIGLDVKYMINLANKNNQDSNNINSTNFNGYAGTSIERLQHYTAGVSARMNF
jgi:hypothetical protein